MRTRATPRELSNELSKRDIALVIGAFVLACGGFGLAMYLQRPCPPARCFAPGTPAVQVRACAGPPVVKDVGRPLEPGGYVWVYECWGDKHFVWFDQEDGVVTVVLPFNVSQHHFLGDEAPAVSP